MAKIYAEAHSEVRPTQLPAAMYSAIGRLVRAFADVEDALLIYICQLAQIKEAGAVVLLGRSPISAKLSMALSLSKLHNKALTEQTSAMFFDIPFKEAKACRNAVAHGILLGEWGRKPKHYAFLTDSQLEPDDFNMRREVVSFRLSDVKSYAGIAATRAAEISSHLNLDSIRGKRFNQSLLPHRKARSANRRK